MSISTDLLVNYFEDVLSGRDIISEELPDANDIYKLWRDRFYLDNAFYIAAKNYWVNKDTTAFYDFCIIYNLNRGKCASVIKNIAGGNFDLVHKAEDEIDARFLEDQIERIQKVFSVKMRSFVFKYYHFIYPNKVPLYDTYVSQSYNLLRNEQCGVFFDDMQILSNSHLIGAIVKELPVVCNKNEIPVPGNYRVLDLLMLYIGREHRKTIRA